MTKIDDGSCAFPALIGPPSEYAPGMSLRDWFAGQALPTLLAELYTASRIAQKGYEGSIFDAASLASFEIADAMIAAKNGGKA